MHAVILMLVMFTYSGKALAVARVEPSPRACSIDGPRQRAAALQAHPEARDIAWVCTELTDTGSAS